MSFVTLRHFTANDIPTRTELLREERFQANLTDFAVIATDDSLVANQSATINSQQHTKRIFTLCGPQDQVLGFAWITSIDWRSQCCELSFGVLPRFRGAYGAAAVAAAHRYLRAELNMRVVINQVLEHNTMLLSAENLSVAYRVRCAYDSYTVGAWRSACYWSETDTDVLAQVDQMADRRRAVADGIRAMARPTA